MSGRQGKVEYPVYGDLRPEISAALKTKKNCALLSISLDNFPVIISSRGGKYSEELVQGLLKEIEKNIGKKDFVSRRAKDNIRVLLCDYKHDVIEKKAVELYDIIISYGSQNSVEPVQFVATVGLAEFPGESGDVEDIINKAYIALSDAKAGEKHIKFYYNQKKHEEDSKNTMVMASYLKNAMNDNRLRLAFQPIIDRRTGDVAYYESLLRIINEDGSATSVGPFIPVAEQMGFVDDIDMLVLKMVIGELKSSEGLKLAINVSNASISNPKWLTLAEELISCENIAKRMIIELTETAEQHNVSKVVDFINILHKKGCQIALDDFGTGYTSFAQLKTLPIDIIKIDGSFVRDIKNNEQSRFFVETLLEFSKRFGLKTVAEFVEDQEIADIIAAMGVDYMQGNYFSPAVNYRDWVDEE